MQENSTFLFDVILETQDRLYTYTMESWTRFPLTLWTLMKLHLCCVLITQLMGSNSAFRGHLQDTELASVRQGHSYILHWINSGLFWPILSVSSWRRWWDYFGQLEEFDPEQGHAMGQHTERLQHYFVANDNENDNDDNNKWLFSNAYP